MMCTACDDFRTRLDTALAELRRREATVRRQRRTIDRLYDELNRDVVLIGQMAAQRRSA
jgi:hypothetical protein